MVLRDMREPPKSQGLGEPSPCLFGNWFPSPDSRPGISEPVLTHTEHHRGLVDVVFKSQESEAIADLLHAWTAEILSMSRQHALLNICTGHLVGLHDLVPFSPRLRRLVIRFVGLIGYKGFEGVGVEGFIELLNHLHVTVEDMDEPSMGKTPPGYPPNLRGSSTLIPLVLGVTGGTHDFAVLVAGR
jgi:hypothetical protein